MLNNLLKSLGITVALVGCTLTAAAQEWTRFSPGGIYVIQAPDGRYLASPLALGGADWDYVLLKDTYVPLSCAWVLNDEGEGDISVRNTNGGANAGDYIMKDSKIRLASTVNFVDYRANQTFAFYRSADADPSGGEVEVAVMSNAVTDRFWKVSSDGSHLDYEVTPVTSAMKFTLIALPLHVELRTAINSANEILADDRHIYDAAKRSELSDAVTSARTLFFTVGYSEAEATAQLESLTAAYDAFKASASPMLDPNVSEMTPAERGAKEFLTLSGDVTDEEFSLIRCEMVRLKSLNLAYTSVKHLPARALAGMNTLEEVILPAGLESIGEGAFLSCGRLSALEIPASVKTIGALAFARSGLTSISFGANVGSIGRYALTQTLKLETISVDPANTSFKSADNLLFTADGTTLVHCPALKSGELILPDGLKAIEPYACMNCTALTGQLRIPETVESIGANAFANCPGLTEQLTLPEGLTTLGRSAFFGSTSAEGTLVVPSGLTEIAPGTFSYSPGLTAIELPSGMTRLNRSAFECCSGIEIIKSDAPAAPAVGRHALRGISREFTFIDVPAGSESAYRAAEVWSEFANYSAPFEGYDRFATDGKYLIQYIGPEVSAEKEPLFLTYTVADGPGTRAVLERRSRATQWQLEFNEPEIAGLTFGSGPATDVFYIRGTSVRHINREGLCYEDPLEGYTLNANRTFAIFISPDNTDEAEPTVAILGNGVLWTADIENLQAETYLSKYPPATGFVWRLTDPDKSAISEVEAEQESPAAYYNLNGVRISAPSAPGVYIEVKNGITRKFIKK